MSGLGLGLVEHALVAIVVQGLIGFATGRWWTAAAATSCYFIGREVAQAEYRWIEHFGGGLRANLPWNAVFDARVWQTTDQIADWLGPLLATTAVALLATRARRGLDGGSGRP